MTLYTPLLGIPPQLFNDNGDVANGYKLYFYSAGTSTKIDTYNAADSTVASVNTNPLVLDSAGRGTIFAPPDTTYKIVLATPTAADPPVGAEIIWTRDGVSSLAPYGSSTDVSATAGENLTALDLVYLSDGLGGRTAGRWYKVDRDLSYSGSAPDRIGFAMSTVTTGNATTVRIDGRLTGFAGLVAGTTYYESSTAGGISTTGYRKVAVADSTTSLVLIPSLGLPFNTDIIGTSGSSFALGDCVYILEGAGTGLWLLARSDQPTTGYTAKTIGFAAEAITSGQTGPIRTRGRVTGLSGLTAGAAYYISSAVSGGITSTLPANPRLVGVADSTTSLVIVPSPPLQAFANGTAVGNVGAGADDLITTPALPANSLKYDNQAVVVDFFGHFANNGNAKTLQIYFGGTKVLDTGSVVYTNVGWSARMLIIRVAAGANQKVNCSASIAGVVPLNGNLFTTSETLTGAITIKCVGTSAAGTTDDVVQDGMIINVLGSPTGA